MLFWLTTIEQSRIEKWQRRFVGLISRLIELAGELLGLVLVIGLTGSVVGALAVIYWVVS